MKRKIIFILVILSTVIMKAEAQLPEISTEENPVWYYIQVIGEGDRAGLVFTAQNGKVYGKNMVISLDESQILTQLWRFEKEGNNYMIINRSTGRKMSLAFDSGKSIRYASVSATPTTTWSLISNGKGYNIKAVSNITEGNSSNIFAHQANDYGSRAYVIMFESSGYQNVDNSRFNFIKYEKVGVEYSTTDKEVWYYITSANPEYADKSITDATEGGLSYIKFSLETKKQDNYHQHWKVVKKSTSANDARIHFINRATGNLIQTKSVENAFYKYTQATINQSEDNGWIMTYMGKKQFEISGKETDGVNRYLCASNIKYKQPDFYDEGNSVNTGFAWLFEGMDIWTSIPNVEIENNVRIYSQDRSIVVEGSDDYTIHTIQGIRISKGKQVFPGIYLVTVNGKTTKLLVK